MSSAASCAAGSAGVYHVTVTASDGSNTGEVSFSWTVQSAIVLANPGLQSSTEGTLISVPISVTRDAGQSLTFSALNLPPGMSIDPSSGVISGVGAAGSAGDYDVNVTASDGTYSGNVSFPWTVVGEVQIVNPGDQHSTDGDEVNLDMQATSVLGLPLTYSASGLPPGLSVNATTGIISGTIAA